MRMRKLRLLPLLLLGLLGVGLPSLQAARLRQADDRSLLRALARARRVLDERGPVAMDRLKLTVRREHSTWKFEFEQLPNERGRVIPDSWFSVRVHDNGQADFLPAL